MITLTAEIKIKEEKNPIVVTNERINNASSSVASIGQNLSSVINTKKDIVVSGVPNYYVGSMVSNGNQFNSPYTIQINTSYSPDKIRIAFDDYNNVYPSEIIINKLETYIPAISGETTTEEEIYYFPFIEYSEDVLEEFGDWTNTNIETATTITKDTTGINVILPEYLPNGERFYFEEFYLVIKGIGEYSILENGSLDLAREQGYFSYFLPTEVGNLEVNLDYVEQIGSQLSHFVLSVSGFDGATEYYFYSKSTKTTTSGGTPAIYENLLDTPITVSVDNPVVMLEGLSNYGKTIDGVFRNYSRIELKISKMNKANVPLTITGIYFNAPTETYKVNRQNLISVESSIFDRGDLKLPNWGIISNRGNIEFNDYDGRMLNYAERLVLKEGLKCEIKLQNTLVDGAVETIGLFETDEWYYDNDNRVVSVSLKDDLEELQEIFITPYEYYPKKTKEISLKGLYDYLYSKTPAKYNIKPPNTTRIEYSYIVYPKINLISLWDAWANFCEISKMYMYKNEVGETVFSLGD